MKVSAFLASCNNQNHKPKNSTLQAKIDPIQIQAASIQKTNANNSADFLSIFQLDIKKTKTYK